MSPRPGSKTSKKASKKPARSTQAAPATGTLKAIPPEEIPLRDPAIYLNRELALLDFNRRVLAQAVDPETPLLERLFFLTICSSNLDEFFEIRVAGLKALVEIESAKHQADGLKASQVLAQVSVIAHELVREQYRILNESILPALEQEGIRVLKRGLWTEAQKRWVADYFESQVLPVLAPLALDPGHPFPAILNKSLNFVVALEGDDAYGRDSDVAIVKVPRALPRVIALPAELSDGSQDFVLLSSIVHAHVGRLFPAMSVRGVHQFRITRNSDLWVDEEESEDLMSTLRGELPSRRYANAVRLEVADTCTDRAAEYLLEKEGLTREDLYTVNGPVNLHRMSALVGLIDRPDLKYPPFVPSNPLTLDPSESVFSKLRARDVLVHHPFQTFAPVVELLQSAAADPNVLAIKQTLYRTGSRSAVVQALIDAASVGKEVTVLVELRARFDEAANIDLATRLQEAGATVVYGIVGFKAHAKLLLIVRREGGQLRRYAHLGTGNYHPGNAKAYTDFGLFTSDPQLCRDVHEVFMQLTGCGQAQKLGKALQSPFWLQPALVELIEQEAAAAKAGRPAFIQARMNSLVDPVIIRSLLRASQAGVKIDLLVRGVCCFRPGIPGISDNIRVRCVVGRFLEHSRVYRFHAGGDDLVYCSSADWMPRNLYRRVEVAFPIEDPTSKARVIDEGLERYFRDNVQAWELGEDGAWTRVRPAGDEPLFVAQQSLLADLAES